MSMDVRSAIIFLHWCKQQSGHKSSQPDIDVTELRYLESNGFIEIHSQESVRDICGIASAEEATQYESNLEEIKKEFVLLYLHVGSTYIRLTPQGSLLVTKFVNAGDGTLFLESPTNESEINLFRNDLPLHGIITIREINEAAKTLHTLLTEQLLIAAVNLDDRWSSQFRPCNNFIVVSGRGKVLAEAYRCQLEGNIFFEEFKTTNILLSDYDKDAALNVLSTECKNGFHPVGTEQSVVDYQELTDEDRKAFESMGWSYGYPGSVPDKIEIYGDKIVLCRLRGCDSK